MRLSAFGVENYRSFVAPVEIELKPLTLLYGYNSSGKSALLRALPLISASLQNTSGSPLALTEEVARQCSFSDLLPHPSISSLRELNFRLSVEAYDHKGLNKTDVLWRIRDLPELKRQVIRELKVCRGDNKDWSAEWIVPTQISSTDLEYEVTHANAMKQKMVLPMEGLLPSWQKLLTPNFNTPERKPLFEAALQLLSIRAASNVQWLTSVRNPPLRRNAYSGSSPKKLGPDGSGAADVFAYDSIEGGKMVADVSAWYEEHLGQRIRVEQSADFYRIVFESIKGTVCQVDMPDVGEGLIQVFPILVATAMARATDAGTRVLALEEPESHLHPHLHAALAKRFCELASSENAPQILVETHSENMLLQIQLQIAQQKLSPDHVAIYWVRRLEDGRSSAERIDFDTLGVARNWPPDVFTDDISQARQLIKQQLARRNESSAE